MKNNKVLIIGLDCLSPVLTFENWLEDLPTIKSLTQSGLWGKLESTIPCITIPAWTSMVTGKDPGQLGFYGFRNRLNYSYDSLYFVNSTAVKYPSLWNILSSNQKESIVIGVPQTYPVKPLNGKMVSCFLTPDDKSECTYPQELKSELNNNSDGYMFDVKEFRTDKKEWLLEQIYLMTDKRFKVIQKWINEKSWDFFMFVEMGPDRIHHAFWDHHSLFDDSKESSSPNVIKDYYIYLDKKIGELLTHLDEQTTVLLVSDHGAKTMLGAFCINEWLIINNLLKLKEYPETPQKLTPDNIIWEKTYCWAEGGYYGRIFFNVKDREPQGIILKEDYEVFLEDLKEQLENTTDTQGKDLGTKVYIPEQIYKECNGIPPDLMVYPGNLNYRALASIGYKSVFTDKNDTGPDNANHDTHGIFVMAEMKDLQSKKIINKKHHSLSIYDVAPTVLEKFDIDVKNYNLEGKVIK